MKTTPCLRIIGFLLLLPGASAVRAQAVSAIPTPAPTAADSSPRREVLAGTRYYDAVPFHAVFDQFMYDDVLVNLFPDLTKRRLSDRSAARKLNRTPRPIMRQLMNA